MNKDWKELTIARLRCIPSVYRICIDKWEGNSLDAIREIERETYIGNFIVEAEKNFLTSLKDGGLLKLVEEDSLLTS